MEWPPSMPISTASLCSRWASSMPPGVATNIISLGCRATCCLTESISSSVRRAYWPLYMSRIDPDGEELRAQIAFAGRIQVEVAAAQGIAEVKVFIHKALRGVGVGIDDQGRAMHLVGIWRLR